MIFVTRRLPVLVMPRERICIGLIGIVPGDSRNDDTGCAILEEMLVLFTITAL